MASTQDLCEKDVRFDHPEKDCLRLQWQTFRKPKQKSLLGSSKLWNFNRRY